MAKSKTPRVAKAVTPDSVGKKLVKMFAPLDKAQRKAAVKFANGVLRLVDAAAK